MESNVPNKKNEVASSSSVKPKSARVIRTMKEDMQEAIERQHETSVTIAVAEKNKNEQKVDPVPVVPSVAKIEPLPKTEDSISAPRPIGRIIVIIAIFVVIALLGVAYVFLLPKIKAIDFKLPSISIHLPSFGKQATTTPTEVPTVIQPLAPSVITADSEIQIDITNKTWAQVSPDITAVVKKDIASGFITNIYLFESTASSTSAISANRFISFANISAPEILTRTLDASFMLGLWGAEGNKAIPFMVLKISEHSAGLAGILAWEAELPSVFDAVFGTTIRNNMTPVSKFRNVVVGGKDLRTLSIKSGETISYAFANENTIIIAGSQSALEALIPLVPTPTSR